MSWLPGVYAVALLNVYELVVRCVCRGAAERT